jgi:hypothetical protein
MTEAEVIVGIYRAFVASVGCGRTILWEKDGMWLLDWESPRDELGRRFAVRYGFDCDRLSLGDIPRGFDEHWGRRLGARVRATWGGSPTREDDGKTLRFQDGAAAVF